METATRSQRVYDHRLKELVHETGDIQLALRHGVPRSTARGWLGRSDDNVVTLDFLAAPGSELRHEVVSLRRRNEKLRAVLSSETMNGRVLPPCPVNPSVAREARL